MSFWNSMLSTTDRVSLVLETGVVIRLFDWYSGSNRYLSNRSSSGLEREPVEWQEAINTIISWAARLGWLENTYYEHFIQRAILTRSLSRSDWPGFVTISWFVVRSVHARLQISVCSGYDLFYTGQHPNTHAHLHIRTRIHPHGQLFWPAYMKSLARPLS